MARRRLAILLALVALAPPPTAGVQSATPAASVLATGQLDSVVALPVYMRLYRVYLPPGQHASYVGSATMLYDLSGDPTIALDGSGEKSLAAGAGLFLAGGQGVKIAAAPGAPSDLLLFVLTPRPNQKPPLDKPAVTKEVFRTGEPLPGLEAGPYAFTLTRLNFPAAMPAAPAIAREGAALDYVVAGSGAIAADGKTETVAAETALAELSGWVHSWANPGAEPLVVIQAGISRQGEEPERPAGAK